MTRRFNGGQRAALYLASGGKCSSCGADLAPGWHADHVAPWSQGGETDVINGQALCPACNLKKGSSVTQQISVNPRKWQQQAWALYEEKNSVDFLCCSCPAAGKTAWALELGRRLINDGTIERVVIVAPTQSVQAQWVKQDTPEKPAILQLTTVDNAQGGVEDHRDFHGCVVTYAQVAKQPDLQRMACGRWRTLVIFDEIHHAGVPQSWGEAMKIAFGLATRRVGLTGTPWRSGKSYIPFVTYDDASGDLQPDYAYGYGQAVRDKVCRAIQFHAYDGQVSYVELKTAQSRVAKLSKLEDDEDRSEILTAILDPDREWARSIVRIAIETLNDIRRGSDEDKAVPDAKGCITADSRENAKKFQRLLKQLGEESELIISNNPNDEDDLDIDAQEALNRFRKGRIKWAVAVDMITEGVNVPELYVGVYASRKRTPLRFQQIVGRFTRRRHDDETRDAVLFLPATQDLMDLASDIATELRHAIDLGREEYERTKRLRSEEPWTKSEPDLVPVNTSDATLDRVHRLSDTYSGAEVTAALDMVQEIGLTSTDIALKLLDGLHRRGLYLAPPPVQQAPTIIKPMEDSAASLSAHDWKQALKSAITREGNSKAHALGIEYRDFHTHLAKRFGPRTSLSIEELEQELDYIRALDSDGVDA